MSIVGHAGNGCIVFTLVHCLMPEGVFIYSGLPLLLWTLYFSLAPDLDVISLFFSRKYYFSNNFFAHRAIGHSLVGFGLFLVVHLMIAQPTINSGLAMTVLFFFLLHMKHNFLDLLTWSSREGIPLFFPFSKKRVAYWGKIKWYNITIITYLSIYMILLPLFLNLGNLPALLWTFMFILLQIVFIVSGEYGHRDLDEEWVNYEKKFIPSFLYKGMNNLISPVLKLWKKK